MASNIAKECGICSEEYNELDRCPRILPCYHTLCSHCILDFMKKGDLKCPFCRKGFWKKKITHFRENDSALELVKYVKDLELKISSPEPSRSIEDDILSQITSKSLEAMTGQIRHLIQDGKIYLVQSCLKKKVLPPFSEQKRYGKISICNNKFLYLHHLSEISVPSDAHLLKFEDVMNALERTSELTFIELKLPVYSKPLGKLFIRLIDNTKKGKNFQILCTGEAGVSYANTKIINASNLFTDDETLHFGDYENGDGSGGQTLVPGAGSEVGGVLVRDWIAGIVHAPFDDSKASQFMIGTRNSPGCVSNCSFGYVEDGLQILDEYALRFYYDDLVISDCGMALEKIVQSK